MLNIPFLCCKSGKPRRESTQHSMASAFNENKTSESVYYSPKVFSEHCFQPRKIALAAALRYLMQFLPLEIKMTREMELEGAKINLSYVETRALIM